MNLSETITVTIDSLKISKQHIQIRETIFPSVLPDFTRRPEGETDQTSSILLRGLHGDRLQRVRHRELAVLHAVQVAAPRRQVEVVRHLESSKTTFFNKIFDTFPLSNHSQVLLHLSLFWMCAAPASRDYRESISLSVLGLCPSGLPAGPTLRLPPLVVACLALLHGCTL